MDTSNDEKNGFKYSGEDDLAPVNGGEGFEEGGVGLIKSIYDRLVIAAKMMYMGGAYSPETHQRALLRPLGLLVGEVRLQSIARQLNQGYLIYLFRAIKMVFGYIKILFSTAHYKRRRVVL